MDKLRELTNQIRKSIKNLFECNHRFDMKEVFKSDDAKCVKCGKSLQELKPIQQTNEI